MPRENGSAHPNAYPPGWVMVIGSLLIIFHLLCALHTTLFTSSGPWPTPNGNMQALPPQFAITIGRLSINEQPVLEAYQRAMRVYSSFRFSSIRQETLEISFEGIFKDTAGNVISKKSIPDPEAPASIRYRQVQLAQQLGNDEPLPPPQAVIIAAPGKTLENVRWWQADGENRMVLKEDNPNSVPRNQNFMTPSASQYLIAKSFARFLGRHHEQPRVELVRYWYEPVLPMVLIEDEAPTADVLRRFQSSYGVLPQ